MHVLDVSSAGIGNLKKGRINRSRINRRHGDAVLPNLLAQRAPKANDRMLCRGVSRRFGRANLAGHRSDIDDTSGTGRLHGGKHRLRAPNHTYVINVHHLGKFGYRHFIQVFEFAVSRIVQQDIHPSELRQDPFEAFLHGSVAADVHLEH
ncbi:hypothetical protein D3C76_1222160 [compost metagenome]